MACKRRAADVAQVSTWHKCRFLALILSLAGQLVYLRSAKRKGIVRHRSASHSFTAFWLCSASHFYVASHLAYHPNCADCAALTGAKLVRWPAINSLYSKKNVIGVVFVSLRGPVHEKDRFCAQGRLRPPLLFAPVLRTCMAPCRSRKRQRRSSSGSDTSQFSELGFAADESSAQAPGTPAAEGGEQSTNTTSTGASHELYPIVEEDVFDELTCNNFLEYARRHPITLDDQLEVVAAMFSYAAFQNDEVRTGQAMHCAGPFTDLCHSRTTCLQRT
jgi:hypothetical protein